MDDAAIQESIGEIRVELDRLVHVAAERSKVTLVVKGEAAIVQRQRIRRIDRQRLIIVGDWRGRCRALFAPGEAAIVEARAFLGSSLDGLVEILDRLVEVVLVVVGDAAAVIGGGEMALSLIGGVEILDRAVVIALVEIALARLK